MVNSSITSRQVDEFVAVAQSLQVGSDCQISAEYGKKYVRIVATRHSDQRSVFCFIDQTNGDVLKAAGWKVPAKGKRGSILAEDCGRSAINEYGANYCR